MQYVLWFQAAAQQLTDDEKIKHLVKKALEESPIAKSNMVFLQYGAIGACLVVFIWLYIWGLKYTQRMHAETIAMVRADQEQTIKNAELMAAIHERNEAKMEKILERYHSDLGEMNTTLALLTEKLPKGG